MNRKQISDKILEISSHIRYHEHMMDFYPKYAPYHQQKIKFYTEKAVRLDNKLKNFT